MVPTGLHRQLLYMGSMYRTVKGLLVYAHTCDGVDDFSALNGRNAPPAYGAADHTSRTPNSKTRNTGNTGNTRNSRKKTGGPAPPNPPMPRRFQISQKVVFVYLVTIEKHLVLHAYLIFSSMYTTMIISILTESKNGPRAPNQH